MHREPTLVMNMNEPAETWRGLLEKLTELPAERQRVATELGVNAFTVTRWVTGESEPRIHSLRKLPEVFPHYRSQFAELIQAEIAPFAPPRVWPSVENSQEGVVPAEYLIRAIAAYATTANGPFRASSMRSLHLQQAIKQLDPEFVGMEMTVVQCVPPLPGEPVRSLCERMSVGTPPWDTGVRRRLLFLGAESLAGWTVGRGEPGVVQNIERPDGLLPFRASIHEKSAAAYPFQREGKLAGCFLTVCTQVGYFTSSRMPIIEVYANLLSLSFRDEQFYPLDKVALHEIPEPTFARQQDFAAHLSERVRFLRRASEFHISEGEAEVHVLQEMEAELLQ